MELTKENLLQLLKENLEISLEADWNGGITMTVYFDGQVIEIESVKMDNFWSEKYHTHD